MIIESSSTVPILVRDAPYPALNAGSFSIEMTASTIASSASAPFLSAAKPTCAAVLTPRIRDVNGMVLLRFKEFHELYDDLKS